MRLALFALLAIAGFLALATGPGGGQRAFASSDFPIEGDADCDLAVDELDALGVALAIADIDSDLGCLDHVDVNCDGNIDVLDLLQILRYRAGVELMEVGDECAGVGSAGGLPPVILSVDENIDVGAETIAGVDGGPARSVAAMVDEDGNIARFVENEVIIITNDIGGELQGFLDKYDAELVKTLDPGTAGMLLPPIHLVRIPDLASIDRSQLQADLRGAMGEVWGSWDASSPEAAGLMALAAGEAADGVQIGLNFILENSDTAYDHRQMAEAPNAPQKEGVVYNPNPFTWPYMKRGGPQNIGVADAWRALHLAGKLERNVRLAILDGGFVPNADFPPGYQMIGPANVENPAACTAGSECPWHATVVTGAAVGVPNNNFGTAGPGGPVADAVLVQSPAIDFFDIVDYILIRLPDAVFPLPDIVNISAGIGIASEWCLTGFCSLIDGLVIGFRELDVLFVVAAGNEDTNVDKEKCIDLVLDTICYEQTAWLPCEASDAICVGGLKWNDYHRISYSNWGNDSDSVDIFGPSVQYLTPTPDQPTVIADSCGTSCASPFVAGVAALIKAADPSMSADTLASTLTSWADPGIDGSVTRIVNAYDAVTGVLGNEPPELEIELDSGTYPGGTAFPLSAFLTDPEDLPFSGGWTGMPTIQWQSSIDGNIGNAPLTPPVLLSYGLHEITATATDSAGITITDSRIWDIVNFPPTVNITTPADGINIAEGQQIILRGTSADQNRASGKLEDSEVQWFTAPVASPQNRTLKGSGHRLRASFLQGDYLLTLVGTDEASATGEDTITIHVGPPLADYPPTAEITNFDFSQACFVSPPNYYGFTGTGDDQEDGTLSGSSLKWYRTVDGGPEQQFGTGTTAQLFTSDIGNSGAVHVILRVTDSGNNTSEDFFDFNHSCVG